MYANLKKFSLQTLLLTVGAVFVLSGVASAAMSVKDIEKKYDLDNKDATALYEAAKADVKKQCEGRGSQMEQCLEVKLDPVIKQYAEKCVKNKKFDDKCAKNLNESNNNRNNGAPTGGSEGDPAAQSDCKSQQNDGCDFVKNYINPAIKALSLIVGVVAAASLILGGIEYASSGGDPQKVTGAKKRISRTIFALVIYAFMYSFLQFIIPGGTFN